MIDTNKRKDLASNHSWEEILTPAGISFDFQVETPKGIKTVWAVDDDPSIKFVTLGESEHLFLADEEGEFKLPFEAIGKYEALRSLHFSRQTQLVDSFLESGSSIIPNLFDLLAEARKDGLAERDPKNRFHEDPAFRRAVEGDLLRIDAREEANRRAREFRNRLEAGTPPALLLTDFLEKELDPERFLIEGLVPINGTVTVVAAKKTGKSTFIYNVMHSLLTGESLLGKFPVAQFEGRVGFVNYELTEEQAQDWFRRSPIRTTDRIAVWNLRGKPNPFRSDEALKDFADEVRSLDIRVLILDPFSSAFRGGNSQDNDEVKEFWLRTDAFKEASGVKELIMPVHAGRDESRSRGASALDDHPDAILHLNKQGDGTRTFHAFGRDVEVEEGELEFDKSSLLLKYKGPATVESRVERVAKELEAVLRSKGKMTATELTRQVRKNKDDVRAARELLVSSGRIVETHVQQKKFYEIRSSIVPLSPVTTSGVEPIPVVVASSPYMGEATALPTSTDSQGICSKCGSKGNSTISSSGELVQMCWDCKQVIEVWPEGRQAPSAESKDSLTGEEAMEILANPSLGTT